QNNTWLVFAVISLLMAVFLLGLWFGRHMPGFNTTPQTAEQGKAQTTPEMQEALKQAEASEGKTQAGRPRLAPGRPMGENRIAEIAAEAAPAVVNVETNPAVPGGQAESKQPFSLNPFAKPNPSIPGGIQQRRFHPLASGSGLIVRSNGYVIT